MGGDLSSIASWTLSALAYGAIHASNSTSELTYLCQNIASIGSRWSTTFPEPKGDVLKFAREAICKAAETTNPSPEPLWKNNLFWMKSYMAAIFTVQTYYGDLYNNTYLFNMCWYVESSLLPGVWAPCKDTAESAVDAESSMCARSGYYMKDPLFQYTNATQTQAVKDFANQYVTRVMQAALRVLVGTEEQVSYLCKGFSSRGKDGYSGRISDLGLYADIFFYDYCEGTERGVWEAERAKKHLLNTMTDLFTYQVLMAGNAKEYPKFLCDGLKRGDLVKAGLDGDKAVAAVCAVANGTKRVGGETCAIC